MPNPRTHCRDCNKSFDVVERKVRQRTGRNGETKYEQTGRCIKCTRNYNRERRQVYREEKRRLATKDYKNKSRKYGLSMMNTPYKNQFEAHLVRLEKLVEKELPLPPFRIREA